MNNKCGGGFKARTWLMAAALAGFAAGCGDGIFGGGGSGSGSGAAAGPGPAGAAPALGAAGAFGGIGGSAGMTNDGLLTVITGAAGQPVSIGTTGASTLMTGFHDNPAGCIYTETPLNVGQVNGTIETAAPPPTSPPSPAACLVTEGNGTTAATAGAALLAANNAFTDLQGRSPAIDPGANLGGQTLFPGIYKNVGGSFAITGAADLTLDAQGNANAVWVFQMASSLTVGSAGLPRSVILINGAQSKNIFWAAGSSATINGTGGGTMEGTIISSAGTSFSTAGNPCCTTLNGRALALTASVTMTNTHINVPAP